MTKNNTPSNPRAKPFSKERSKMIICRVIYFYSLFYVVMKLIAIVKGYGLLPNLITGLPFVIFAILGIKMDRQKKYSWLYVLIGILVISAMRYFESDLLAYFRAV